jgi:hypothetical protein
MNAYVEMQPPAELQIDPSILGRPPPPAASKGKRKRPSTIISDICDMFSLPHLGERRNTKQQTQ